MHACMHARSPVAIAGGSRRGGTEEDAEWCALDCTPTQVDQNRDVHGLKVGRQEVVLVRS